MHIVIATAEPRGAYHLHPISQAAARSSHTYTHLLPYPEPTQGRPDIATSSDSATLEKADRVVVTGGTLTSWTELVTYQAKNIGVPVLYTELAYLGRQLPASKTMSFPRATAMSPHSAEEVGRYLNTAQVETTGTPALDNLPLWQPRSGHALLLSTSESQARDPQGTLRLLADTLKRDGWHVSVRLHPREDQTPWEGYMLDNSHSPACSAAKAEIVVGYPGSVHVVAAAVGVPTVSLAPTSEMRNVLTPAQQAACSACTRSVSETMDLLPHVAPAPRSAVAHVVGPIGGAAERMLQAWSR